MAIDDNTVYGLTGAQLKELPGKIEAVKGAARVLTTADYNWPTSNPDGVKMWDLPAGFYNLDNGVRAYIATGAVFSEARAILVTYNGGITYYLIFPTNDGTMPIRLEAATRSNGTYQSGYFDGILGRKSIVDTLTSTETTRPLSAKQGKALKALIDALDTDLQSQIDAIVASSDVKDIVGTKADLNNYDTSTLGDKDIIKVLADESQNNATTYYRWSVSGAAFTLIGSEGPYYTKSQTDTLVNAKADASTTYTKSEVDTALSGKVDNATLGNYATTTAMNTALASKANTADVYTKTQVDSALDEKADAPAAGTTYVTDTAMTTALATKADASTTYTKTEVDTALASKAGTSTATTSANGLMSSADKTKLNGIAAGAEANVQSDWNQTNTSADNFIKNKPTIPTVPTKVSAFTNDSGYQTASDVSAAISSMAPIVTLTNTDPGEGQPLPSNQLLGVY